MICVIRLRGALR